MVVEEGVALVPRTAVLGELAIRVKLIDVRVGRADVDSPDVELDRAPKFILGAFESLAHGSALEGTDHSRGLSPRGTGVGTRGTAAWITETHISAAMAGGSVTLAPKVASLVGPNVLSLGVKDLSSLHSGNSRPSTNHDGDIGVLESNEWIGSGDDAVDAVVSSVIKFHEESLGSRLISR